MAYSVLHCLTSSQEDSFRDLQMKLEEQDVRCRNLIAHDELSLPL